MKKIMTFLLAVVLVAAMAVPAFAANFTPSVENKGAPDVVDNPVIYKPDGTIETTVPTGDLIVTPVAERENAEYTDITNRLETAYNNLQKKSLYSLCGMSTIGGVSVNDLVVRDLFDVTVKGTYVEKLSGDNYLKITFKVSDATSLVGALFTANGTTWTTISGSDMMINSDGTVTITVREVGVVAFLYDNGTIPNRNHKKNTVDDGEHYAPQTSDPTWCIMGCAAAGGAVILAAVGMAEKRKSFGKQDA